VFYPHYSKGIVNPGVSQVIDGNVITDPLWNPVNGSYRVFRGGGWDNAVGALSLAYRAINTPVDVTGNLGFRPVLVP
jgi:formylglycine-generating enzyme required for sulfatase activity